MYAVVRMLEADNSECGARQEALCASLLRAVANVCRVSGETCKEVLQGRCPGLEHDDAMPA